MAGNTSGLHWRLQAGLLFVTLHLGAYDVRALPELTPAVSR